jgi:hypothetical protein
MGVLSPGSAHARPYPQPPIVCRVTFKHLPQPLRSYIQSFEFCWRLISPFFVRKKSLWSFRTLTDLFLIISTTKLRIAPQEPWGGGGGGGIFFTRIFIFYLLGTDQLQFVLYSPLIQCKLLVVQSNFTAASLSNVEYNSSTK